jgi:hypothetical protein
MVWTLPYGKPSKKINKMGKNPTIIDVIQKNSFNNDIKPCPFLPLSSPKI